MPKGLFYLLSPSNYKWLVRSFQKTFLLLQSYTGPPASPGRAQADVQLAFLLGRAKARWAGAGSPEQTTGRCVGAGIS